MCPHPRSSAWNASPSAPFSRLRRRPPSFFICPIADGTTAADVTPQALDEVALEIGVVDLGARLHVQAAIALVHKDFLGLAVGQDRRKRPALPSVISC